MIRVGVCGASGRMGQEVIRAVLEAPEMEVKAAIDIVSIGEDIGKIAGIGEIGVKIENNLEDILSRKDIDVIVDFTIPNSIFENAKKMLKTGVRPVIGTTGLSLEQLKELENLSKENNTGCFIAPNFTTGAVLMMMFAREAAKYFDNAEIIELHHNKKKDAPSGTAIKTAEMMAQSNPDLTKGNVEEIELIKGSRGGVSASNIHIHSVRMPGYIASQEVIFGSSGQVFKIRHDSMDRTCYMPGVLMSIKHVAKNNDFVYGLENIL